jgi:hypothetical protein
MAYLALEPHFQYRNGRHKEPPALEEYTNRPGDVVLQSPNSFFTCSINPTMKFQIRLARDLDQEINRLRLSDPSVELMLM